MTDLRDSPLGHATTYGERYDPRLLFAVDRKPLRDELGVGDALPFRGVDRWNAYELSWLDHAGKPQVAIGSFDVPADSPRIVESKSVKLYLTALNLVRFDDAEAVRATIARDLGAATGSNVVVALVAADRFGALSIVEPRGESLDDVALAVDEFVPHAGILACSDEIADEALYTRLFRSVCPVTAQPDYATVEIAYRGRRLDRAALLRYLVSFRRHGGFHEHCVERIFVDIQRRCAPRTLSVNARFTRRGGIDINPFRTSGTEPPPQGNLRDARQ
jgi:7-cyano-7-deazaguanine reductase